ncbi:CLUMA_CG013690, isoform A [Clunio marinus]|uniref:glutathione transferase n=1 Tax=Clunio marinus TaxID=568069 RepID=A0A1J1IJQ6_9DIPT|nr:CLUMA_CG013690, isoform A [Clunio marinus]
MSSSLIFYHALGSPPSRSCLMLLRKLNLDVEVKLVDLSAGEQNDPKFLKLNPLHQVPVLVDGDFVLTESRAILAYLLNKFQPESDLFPQDPKARAVVDQKLYYDATVVFESFAQIVRSVLYKGNKKILKEDREKLVNTLNYLDNLLSKTQWFAGNNITIADYSILGTITTLKEFGYDLAKHSNLNDWYGRCQSFPGFQENVDGSPPSRAVLQTIRVLGLEVEVKKLDLMKGENLTSEFLGINPLHQVPVLIDGKFVVAESRAIMTYLINSRRPDCDWYPMDPKVRARIDQLLYFEAINFFELVVSILLYHTPGSPPSRTALMAIRNVGADVEIVTLNLLAGEHQTPEFAKLNPLKRVPVLVDGDYVLNESRAILGYLANSRKPGSSLYPSDPKARGLVDQFLYYDAGSFFGAIGPVLGPILFRGVKEVSTENLDRLKGALAHLNSSLEGKKYFAGNQPTIADISIISNMNQVINMFGHFGNYPNIKEWYKRCSSLPGFDENAKGAKVIGELLASKAPARSALMAIRNVDADVEIINFNLLTGEHKNPEFEKLNPLKLVPVLVDGDYVLNESRAILGYLANSRKPGSSLYPSDPKARGLVDQFLYYDLASFFGALVPILIPILYKGVTEILPEDKERLKGVLSYLNSSLEGKKYFAGDHPTIADISIISDMNQVINMFGHFGNYPNLKQWYIKKRLESIMTLTLYYSPVSPPSRCVLLTLINLGIEFDIKIVNLAAGDHKTSSFGKLNPQRTVPVVIDDGFVMSESRAIITYLVDTKSPDSSLYPTDPKIRYAVNHKLFYDATVFSTRLAEAMYPIMRGQETVISQEAKDNVLSTLDVLDNFLDGNEWISGTDEASIADLSILAAFSTLYHVGQDISSYPNLSTWYERCSNLPGFAENEKGAKMFAQIPRCCVPTLVDHEFILWESKAILIYLAEKYAKNSHALYPKCVKTRAVIHQRLFHDSSDFYVRILDIANLAFSSSSTTTVATVTAQHWENLKKSLLILENFLEGYEYFAGNCMTIADFAYLASISTLVHFGFNLSPYTNVNNWYRRMRDVSGFQECEQGAREFGAIVKGKLTNLFESI